MSEGFPEGIAERHALADKLAEEVRRLCAERDAVPDGSGRRAKRKLIGLQIDVRRWKMHILNPKKYKGTRKLG